MSSEKKMTDLLNENKRLSMDYESQRSELTGLVEADLANASSHKKEVVRVLYEMNNKFVEITKTVKNNLSE